MTSSSVGQGKEISGADLGTGPLRRIHSSSDTRAPVNMLGIESCCSCSVYQARAEPFGAVGENELHVPSETIGTLRHMLFTWN